MPVTRTEKHHWPPYALFALLGMAALCFSFIDICPFIEIVVPSLKISKSTIINFILSLGARGPLGSIGLMIMHSFVPFPAEFLTISNGMVFGPFWGVVITWIGAMFILYAHLVPELRALGTALLAGASVVSVVFGFAALNTLGNLVAGISLVLCRPIRVGDNVQTTSPKGLIIASEKLVTLGNTVLRDPEANEVIVPNSVMMSSIVIRIGKTRTSPV